MNKPENLAYVERERERERTPLSYLIKISSNKLLYFFLIFLLFCNFSFASEVRFAHVSDIHYKSGVNIYDDDFRMLHYTKSLLEEAISKINSDKNIQFTIVTGDAAHDANIEEFRIVYNMLNKLNNPWYYTLGNHDIDFTEGSAAKNDHIRLLNKINPKGFSGNNTYYSFKPSKDITFIGLDTIDNNIKTVTGYLPYEQLEFTDNILKNLSNNDVAILFMHNTIDVPEENPNLQISNHNELEQILHKYKFPILVLGGHVHSTRIVKDKNIIKVMSPALASYPNAFRIITVNNSKNRTVIGFEYVETANKIVQKISKVRFYALGRTDNYLDSDKNQIIIIDKEKQSLLQVIKSFFVQLFKHFVVQ